MKLTPASHVVLGMLNLGARSGYEIRRTIEISARFFWTISPVQIYPELKRLEESGLVKGREAPRGGRQRRTYTITAAGKRALRQWLESPEEPAVEWRDAGLLKLFFADALPADEAIARLGAIRQRSERLAKQFRSDIVPVAERNLERNDERYPLLAARFGLDYHEWVVDWCTRRERELRASAARGGRKAPA
jgi:PadR family transcriptional regulator, regulatory protein AphA